MPFEIDILFGVLLVIIMTFIFVGRNIKTAKKKNKIIVYAVFITFIVLILGGMIYFSIVR